jgi:hypothetical protein
MSLFLAQIFIDEIEKYNFVNPRLILVQRRKESLGLEPL